MPPSSESWATRGRRPSKSCAVDRGELATQGRTTRAAATRQAHDNGLGRTKEVQRAASQLVRPVICSEGGGPEEGRTASAHSVDAVDLEFKP